MRFCGQAVFLTSGRGCSRSGWKDQGRSRLESEAAAETHKTERHRRPATAKRGARERCSVPRFTDEECPGKGGQGQETWLRQGSGHVRGIRRSRPAGPAEIGKNRGTTDEIPSSPAKCGLDFRIARTSDRPSIPNFEILSRIGGGSYGEVYLARSVTGMYRAVKVVRREDFEYERTFEREFEGIQRYEKVSQDHPGLVDVLHVGRDAQAGFYYYVMELADDESGESVEQVGAAYKPRTLSSDLRRGRVRPVRECVDLGVAIAGALGHLHHAGLTHRDVKPSNIIFVKGQPKLADVGLVASTGQRTFVGTEGYVPPEGPGTSSADLYSLAMVLYEMHTGKDRLDFPELPTNLEISPSVNRDEWRALNGVICRAGSPDPRKRYESAFEFAKALRGVCAPAWKTPERKRSALPAFFGTFAVLGLLALVGGGGYWLWKDQQSFVQKHGPMLADRGDSKGINGAGLRTPIGPVAPINDPRPPKGEAGEEKGPASGDSTDDTGAGKSGEASKGAGPAGETREPEPKKEPESKGPDENPAKDPQPDGIPDPDKPAKGDSGTLDTTVVQEDGGKSKDKPSLVANPVVQGQVKVMSHPPAARVYHEGREIGLTETRLLDFPVGPVELVLKREGYRDFVHRGEIREGAQVITATLLPDLGPVPGSSWINSLGMEFVPVVGERHQSLREVTVEQFDRFLDETGKQIPRGGLGGIVQVSDEAARWQFCDWLTSKDRATGHLGSGHYYRPQRNPDDARKNSFFCSLEHDFGTLILNSEPPGAGVFRDGNPLGETPLVLDKQRLGAYSLELIKPGYEVATATGVLESTEAQDLVVTLQRDASVVFQERWTNSQEMELVPVGNLLVAAYETPARDYLEFVAAQGVPVDSVATDAGLHPAAGVSHAEAVAFCEWLTKTEQSLQLIRPWQRYRLPTDLEWSRFAGLSGETGATPEQRNRSGNEGFPWGADWPPPARSGNFADVSASAYFGSNVLEGYNDGFPTTSPVGSFAASATGLFDLSGNVWEWVQEPFSDGADGLHVVRGGGWNSAEREVLATAYRNPVPSTSKEAYYGFRYVLEEVAPD